jgi:Cu+-exporting ATPase
MQSDTALVKDPVCGMEIDPNTAADKRTFQGKDIYFCSKGCAKVFDADPRKYAGAS